MKKTREVTFKEMTLLPPKPDVCQECAVDHNQQDSAHDKTSWYYQIKFKMDHGIEPHWCDAAEHLPEELRVHWKKALEESGEEWGRPWSLRVANLEHLSNAERP